MINSTQITIIGNVGGAPDVRYTPTGTPVTSFSVAVTGRKFDKESGKWADTDTTWYRVNAWRSLAEHVAGTLQAGMRVIVVGSIAARTWENGDQKGIAWEITADAVGPDLQYSTALVRKAARVTGDGASPEPSGTQE